MAKEGKVSHTDTLGWALCSGPGTVQPAFMGCHQEGQRGSHTQTSLLKQLCTRYSDSEILLFQRSLE